MKSVTLAPESRYWSPSFFRNYDEKLSMKTLTQTFVLSLVILSTSFASAQSSYEAASVSSTYTQQIETLVNQSACYKYSWKNRGQAPAGYVRGVALSFARSLCREKSNTRSSLATILSSASSSSSTDALAYFKSAFAAMGVSVSTAGEENIRSIYTLGMGLGMRESSGEYCTGWDTTAGKNRPSSEAEAGPFQTSYDSMSASPALAALYKEYQADTSRCLLDVFKVGVSCKKQSILGTGAGATYQVFNKSCPAFATEYAMTLLRLVRTHFGPINRKEAEVVPACNSLLTSVQQIVDQNPSDSCAELD